MSQIAFDVNKYLIIISNHGWYEVHDIKKRKEAIKNNNYVSIPVGLDSKPKIYKKEINSEESLLFKGSVKIGFVDDTPEDILEAWTKVKIYKLVEWGKIK